MPKPISSATMSLALGQCYKINSFDLGFINVMPIDLFLEIKKLDIHNNELELSLILLTSSEHVKTKTAIARWFSHSYPGLTKENCRLKNAAAFQHLVDLHLAILLSQPIICQELSTANEKNPLQDKPSKEKAPGNQPGAVH